MPLLNLKLGVIYVPFIINPDLIGGGLLTVDSTFITVDSIMFTADNEINHDAVFRFTTALKNRAAFYENESVTNEIITDLESIETS